jgi:hypothetical protein
VYALHAFLSLSCCVVMQSIPAFSASSGKVGALPGNSGGMNGTVLGSRA